MGGCATKPKDLKAPAPFDAPLPQQEEPAGAGEQQTREVHASEDDKAKGEEGEKEKGEEEKSREEEAKEAANGKEKWHLDENNRRSLGVLFMEDDDESGAATATAETSGHKESEAQLDGTTADEKPPVVTEGKSTEVKTEQKESDTPAEGSPSKEDVDKQEDTSKAEESADKQTEVPPPIPPVVVPIEETEDKAISHHVVPLGGEDAQVAIENPKLEEKPTKEVHDNDVTTEGSKQEGSGAADSSNEAVVLAATIPLEVQNEPFEQQKDNGGETSTQVHVEAASVRDIILEEQQPATETEGPVTISEAGDLPIVGEHVVEKFVPVDGEESSQAPPPLPVDVVASEAAVVEVEKSSDDIRVDEPVPKIESAIEGSKPAVPVAADEPGKADANETEKAAEELRKTAASDTEKAADEQRKAETSDTEKEATTGDAVADTGAVNQDGGKGGDELIVSSPGSTAA